MYFTNDLNDVVFSETPVTEEGWTEITREQAVTLSQAKTDALTNDPVFQLRDLKAKLAATDFKVLPDYDQDVDQGLLDQRALWRTEIRALETQLGLD